MEVEVDVDVDVDGKTEKGRERGEDIMVVVGRGWWMVRVVVRAVVAVIG